MCQWYSGNPTANPEDYQAARPASTMTCYAAADGAKNAIFDDD
jgi:hypothetical protein